MSYFRMVATTLSSAMRRFTVLFEMGRSGAVSLLSPSIFFYIYPTLIFHKDDSKETIIDTYHYFKQNKVHTIICTAITFILTTGTTYILGLFADILNNTAINATLISLFTLLTTLIITIISVWSLLFTFKSY